MSSRPSCCPSCGGPLPGPGIACPACGFTVRDSDDVPDDQALAGRGRAWGGTVSPLDAGSLPPITPPAAVGPPPSQISVDGIEMHWSSGLSRQVAWGASPTVAGGRQGQAPATRPAGAPPSPAAGMAAFTSSGAGNAPGAMRPRSGPSRDDAGQIERAAARARERRDELSRAAGPAVPSSVPPAPVAAASAPPVAVFDQVLSSDFRGTSAISGGATIAAPAVAAQTRWAPSGASAVDFPGWFRGIPAAVTGASRGRHAHDRAPLPKAAVWLAVAALLFVGLMVFTAYAQRWSITPDTSGVGASSDILTMPAPSFADRAAVHRDLAALTAIAVPPSAPAATARPAAALRAHRLRVRLMLWRDRFRLTAHQRGVLDHAVIYAGALARWLETPGSGARRAAALKAWRVWRADDPSLRTR